jgi:Ca2+-transporting ATPase
VTASVEGTSHDVACEVVFARHEVDAAAGLGAGEVVRRQKAVGLNSVTARPGTPAWWKFLRQFHQPLVYILLAAVGITAALGEWVDSAVIATVVLVNAVVGFLQEAKAEKSIESLAKMVATEATVRRDGRKQRVHSDQLVPGDVVLLESGDRVPGDLRLFKVKGLRIDESALTGESLPVEKQIEALAADTVLGDRTNLAFTGTLVAAGQGEGVVCATGDRTETGHIARLIAEAVDLSTPLTKKIAHLSRLLLWVILGLAAVAFVVGVVRGGSPVDMFMAAVALAVGAIPEGLPAAVTIVLAIGVSRMAKRRAIIRKLPAVETLGGTTIICSDKTGTLTENQMTVREVFAGGVWYEVAGTGYEPTGEITRDGAAVVMTEEAAEVLADCLRAGVLCNDAQLLEDGMQGDPTEAALLVAGAKAGFDGEALRGEAPRLDVIPFESAHMFRATLHKAADGGRVVYVVGAVERLLERCTDGLGDGGDAAVLDAVKEMAGRGLRVLALAKRGMDAGQESLGMSDVEGGLTFLGLQGMIDPPRAEATAAVKTCQGAGIAVKMITGDHLITARAIAGQIGLRGREADGQLVAMEGRALEKLSDEELSEVAESTAVFARVAPEQKLRLVRALQARGHVVAMTGDGVNDAPALKQADIGVAMGITGTDVSKAAADMILTDDNFASIEAAVEEGRGVFDNLTKFIVWTLPTNAGEAAILLTAIVFGMQLPAVPVQLLWVNMMTSVLLGLTLVFEAKERDLMQRPPRDPELPLISRELLMRTGLVTAIMLAGGLWLFHWEMAVAGETLAEARTAVINVIVAVEIAYLFSCRSLTHSLREIGVFTNRWVLGGAGAMIAAQLAFTYAPWMNRLFHSAPIGGGTWVRILSVAGVAFAAVEFEKWVRHGRA